MKREYLAKPRTEYARYTQKNFIHSVAWQNAKTL